MIQERVIQDIEEVMEMIASQVEILATSAEARNCRNVLSVCYAALVDLEMEL